MTDHKFSKPIVGKYFTEEVDKLLPKVNVDNEQFSKRLNKLNLQNGEARDRLKHILLRCETI